MPIGRSARVKIAALPLSLVLAAGACSLDPASPTAATTSGGDGVTFVSVAANPESVCSAIVAFSMPGAATATVTATGANGDVLTTPEVTLASDGSGSIAVLGLAAATTYDFTATAVVGGETQSSDAATFTTAPLPFEISQLKMAITPGTGMPSPTGYYLVEGTGNDEFAVDGKGTLRWYRQFDNFAEEAKMQPDGSFTTFVGSTPGFGAFAGIYARYRPDGSRLASYAAASPDASEGGANVYTDNHELQITKDADGVEHLHFIAYEFRPLSATDTTDVGAWHEVVRERADDGTVEFQWKTWSRFTFDGDSNEGSGVPGVYDVDHMNSVKFDPNDDDYIVSMRAVDAVLKLDKTTGDVRWQLGGNQSTFTFPDDPWGGFAGQHDAQTLPNGHVILYDNGLQHMPNESRACEYALDLDKKTASLVWEFRHDPPIFTPIEGAIRKLSNGDTLVAFAEAGVVDEVTPNGDIVWEGQVELGTAPIPITYRIIPLPSLYSYVVP